MTRESLLLFIKRILECGSEDKSEASLRQLESILKMQNADPEMIILVSETIKSIPEAKAAAKNRPFTKKSLDTAIRRAEARKQRESEMRKQGRCG